MIKHYKKDVKKEPTGKKVPVNSRLKSIQMIDQRKVF